MKWCLRNGFVIIIVLQPYFCGAKLARKKCFWVPRFSRSAPNISPPKFLGASLGTSLAFYGSKRPLPRKLRKKSPKRSSRSLSAPGLKKLGKESKTSQKPEKNLNNFHFSDSFSSFFDPGAGRCREPLFGLFSVSNQSALIDASLWRKPLQNLYKSSSTQPKTQPSKRPWERAGSNISRFKLFRRISYTRNLVVVALLHENLVVEKALGRERCSRQCFPSQWAHECSLPLAGHGCEKAMNPPPPKKCHSLFFLMGHACECNDWEPQRSYKTQRNLHENSTNGPLILN